MGMELSKFLKSPEYDIKITTYRDIFQIGALEQNRFGEEYRKLSAAVMMSKEDMRKMGFKQGDRVKLTSDCGSIVVELRETRRDEPGGVAFMVNSPWSNSLVSDETGGKGIPEFKNITARISLTKDDVTPLESLIGILMR
ncbi:MAG: formylmethanofuran dehydrogenase [Candidatus Methanoperedens sp.]|nr:formylmethanofuran dehydrogenase [Candidatus Methanoperedens sp.]